MVWPKRKKFFAPTTRWISTLAPSSVPMVRAPFIVNFMLPVPEASLLVVETCSGRSAAGWMRCQLLTLKTGMNTTRSASRTRASQVITSSTAWISLSMR